MKQSTWYLLIGGILSGISGLAATWFLIRASAEMEREEQIGEDEQEIPLITAPERPGERVMV